MFPSKVPPASGNVFDHVKRGFSFKDHLLVRLGPWELSYGSMGSRPEMVINDGEGHGAHEARLEMSGLTIDRSSGITMGPNGLPEDHDRAEEGIHDQHLHGTNGRQRERVVID